MSQWGLDFRPEYRALTVPHERFPGVPRIALTATADALTRDDIIERLQLQRARLFISSSTGPTSAIGSEERRTSPRSCCASSNASTRVRRGGVLPVAQTGGRAGQHAAGRGHQRPALPRRD